MQGGGLHSTPHPISHHSTHIELCYLQFTLLLDNVKLLQLSFGSSLHWVVTDFQATTKCLEAHTIMLHGTLRMLSRTLKFHSLAWRTNSPLQFHDLNHHPSLATLAWPLTHLCSYGWDLVLTRMPRPLTSMSSQHCLRIRSARYILARLSNCFSSRICV